MQENNFDIQKALQSNMQGIDDDSFTERIVNIHLSKKQAVKPRPFINFKSLIIGLSAVLISIGFVLMQILDKEWYKETGLTESHGLILLVLSIIFLLYKWIEDLTAPTRVY